MHELINTGDGSHTIVSKEFGVTYHSIHGALQETDVIFIEMGLKYLLDKGNKEINIFEMGFGTGLNALRTMMFAENYDCNINYTTIEMYPIKADEISAYNYLEVCQAQHLANEFVSMHNSKNGDEIVINNKFSFTKIIDDIETYEASKKHHLIYYDAFAPSAQPALWELPIITKMYKILHQDGILCTYCAKGSFKRTLKEVGFSVENLPGPGRKREVTRATRNFRF